MGGAADQTPPQHGGTFAGEGSETGDRDAVSRLTPAFLTEALASELHGARVERVEINEIGTGQMARCLRLSLFLDDGRAPYRVVAKVPSTDEKSRATGLALRSYEIEVRFYQQLAPRLPVRTPRCLHAEIDTATGEFLLLLEDLSGSEPGDQLLGCSVDQAAAAVEELAKLHAPLWGDPSLEHLDWLHREDDGTLEFTVGLVSSLFPGFAERYADRLEPEVLETGRLVVERLPAYLAGRSGPWTVTHGDYRIDNLLFPVVPSAPPIVVVDWQTAAHGPGVADLSYLLGASLLPELRRQHERSLVEEYWAALRSLGVEDLALEECWTQYRRYSVAGLVMAIAASMLVEQTARGDEMFVAMAQRHGRHAIDLDALALVEP
jgi:aminoglycoside/choline kinase family phosphotransferase